MSTSLRLKPLHVASNVARMAKAKTVMSLQTVLMQWLPLNVKHAPQWALSLLVQAQKVARALHLVGKSSLRPSTLMLSISMTTWTSEKSPGNKSPLPKRDNKSLPSIERFFL